MALRKLKLENPGNMLTTTTEAIIEFNKWIRRVSSEVLAWPTKIKKYKT